MLDEKILADLKNTLLYNPVNGTFIRKADMKLAYLKPNKNSSPRVLVNGKEYAARSVACYLMTGIYPDKYRLKSLDGNKDNLRWENIYVSKEGHKFCTKCKTEKPISAYSKNSSRKAGHEPVCKECKKPWNATSNRKTNLKKFGLTLEEYEAIHRSQNDVCAICEREETNKRLAVDHCHTKGNVRGLLCMGCNTAIGKLNTPELLNKAIKYLST